MLQVIICSFILILIVTGGVRGKVELAQVDVFGWAALCLGLYHWRRTGEFFSVRLKRIISVVSKYAVSHTVRLLFVIISCHIVLYSLIQVWGYQSFEMNAYDAGFIDQAIWTTAFPADQNMIFLHSDLSRGLGSYLSEHFSPILAIFVPLYRLWDSIYWIFFIHSLLIGIGGLLVYKLARQYKHAPAFALLFAVSYFLYQPLRAASIFNFREDVFYIPIFLGMILALEQSRWATLWILALASLTVKENAALVVFAFGVWLILRRRHVQGAALSLTALTAFWIINSKIMPQYSGGASNTVFSSRLYFLGSNTGEIIRQLTFHPFESAYKIYVAKFTAQTLKYLLVILLPFVPFLKFRPLSKSMPIFIALGLLAMNLLISEHVIGFHYQCIMIPFLFAALISGFSERKNFFQPANAATLLITLFLCVYGRSPMLVLREWYPTKIDYCLSEVLKLIPQEASITAQGGFYAHIDHRYEAKALTIGSTVKEDFVIASFLPNVSQYPAPDLSKQINEVDRLGYKKIVDRPEIILWCKDDACEKYAPAIADIRQRRCLTQTQN